MERQLTGRWADRASPVCVMATVRVARAAASSFSADRTVAAESSRSGTAPMMSTSGSRASRWVLTVTGMAPNRDLDGDRHSG